MMMTFRNLLAVNVHEDITKMNSCVLSDSVEIKEVHLKNKLKVKNKNIKFLKRDVYLNFVFYIQKDDFFLPQLFRGSVGRVIDKTFLRKFLFAFLTSKITESLNYRK